MDKQMGDRMFETKSSKIAKISKLLCQNIDKLSKDQLDVILDYIDSKIHSEDDNKLCKGR
jgi:hypothetical protein